MEVQTSETYSNSYSSNDVIPGKPFKECTKCGYTWETIEQFVLDTTLLVNGYQAIVDELESGLFILTHNCPECQTSISVTVNSLVELRTDFRDYENKIESEECERHCINKFDIEPCKQACANRWVRDVLQYLVQHRLPPEYLAKRGTKTQSQ